MIKVGWDSLVHIRCQQRLDMLWHANKSFGKEGASGTEVSAAGVRSSYLEKRWPEGHLMPLQCKVYTLNVMNLERCQLSTSLAGVSTFWASDQLKTE
jgi:hypothetical protein